MREKHLHAADEELLLHCSGELPASSSPKILAHLEQCSQCRTRLEELQSTLAEYAGAHRDAVSSQLPPMAAARAGLKQRMAQLAAQDRRESEHAGVANRSPRLIWAAFSEHRQSTMLGVVALAACLLVAVRLHAPEKRSYPQTASLGHWEKPDARLTPGATLPVTQSQVCGAEAANMIPAVPVSLKRKVFEEYGVTSPEPDAYEVDYLITPELGGATDIRNLWPEPSQDILWNSYVKDQLEDRLHRMVCSGDVDLATAQHDISTDWIGAYRKYFHADRPVTDNASLNATEPKRSVPLT
jgi:hypothetical protein